MAGGAAGKLLLNKKGWLGHDEIVLHKGEGPVSAIAWRCAKRSTNHAHMNNACSWVLALQDAPAPAPGDALP